MTMNNDDDHYLIILRVNLGMANELIMVKFPLLKIDRKWFEPRSFLPC